MCTRRVRTVEISALVPRGKRVKARLWAYGYADIAAACGITIAAVRKACQARNGRQAALDPSSLPSVAAFIEAHARRNAQTAHRMLHSPA
jgi:hypothetical protein